MELLGVSAFERFFREAASLDVDKDDLRRFGDFVNDRLYDLSWTSSPGALRSTSSTATS